MLDVEQCSELIRSGDIDTVLVAFPDLQGRLMGKRVTGHFFLDEVLGGDGGIHACDYLLAVDVEMTPLPGYRFTSWDTGYGDCKAVPDLATLRTIPWLEKTALVLCDLVDEDGAGPIEVSPRRILRRQIERAQEHGFTVKIGSELEFYLFEESYEEAAAKGYSGLTPHASYIEDYHILQTTKDEYLIRQIRNGMDGAGVPVEFSKGEAGRGQHEINLVYAGALEMADRHTIYKNGAKEIAALNDRAISFMAKWSMAEGGSSCHVHSSLWDATRERSLTWDDDAPDHMSEPYRHYLGGLLATTRELTWMYAPYVNSYKRFQPDSWAPTAIVWARDNRTCGYRTVGHGPSFRIESRIPGADCNPYLAFAATIAAGLHGIENEIEPGSAFEGNAYEATDVARLPTTLAVAADEFAGSEMAVAAFGDDVHHHLVNTARQEWAASNRAVTDWELGRYFERM
ncbi:MAG: glutamine synthetase family protein [Acidimicrobiia bacterium]|nr:glutamine synthetase family protein [Acidimicrobiia bacterium]